MCALDDDGYDRHVPYDPRQANLEYVADERSAERDAAAGIGIDGAAWSGGVYSQAVTRDPGGGILSTLRIHGPPERST